MDVPRTGLAAIWALNLWMSSLSSLVRRILASASKSSESSSSDGGAYR